MTAPRLHYFYALSLPLSQLRKVTDYTPQKLLIKPCSNVVVQGVRSDMVARSTPAKSYNRRLIGTVYFYLR